MSPCESVAGVLQAFTADLKFFTAGCTKYAVATQELTSIERRHERLSQTPTGESDKGEYGDENVEHQIENRLFARIRTRTAPIARARLILFLSSRMLAKYRV